MRTTIILFKIFLFSYFSLILLGCKGQPKPITVYTPTFNTTTTSEIGQNMFEKTYAIYDYTESVKIEDQNIQNKYRENSTVKYYFQKKDNNKCVMLEKYKNFNSRVVLEDLNCDGYFTKSKDQSLFEGDELKVPLKYHRIPSSPSSIINDSFKYVVLYQGKVQNKLNISFQSFLYSVNGFLIRDAYTQNIQYELDNNGEAIIGFKGLRIKVLKATNLDITYKVLKDYN